MVQFIFEGARTNFSFWSTFSYFLVKTGVHLKLKLGQKKIKIKKNQNFQQKKIKILGKKSQKSKF